MNKILYVISVIGIINIIFGIGYAVYILIQLGDIKAPDWMFYHLYFSYALAFNSLLLIYFNQLNKK